MSKRRKLVGLAGVCALLLIVGFGTVGSCAAQGLGPSLDRTEQAQTGNEEAHPGLGLEALYARAVLAFNRQQIEEALTALDQVLSAQPDNAQALELKGLALKSEGKDKDALETYIRLIRLKPPHERAPYYFEAAILLNREGRTAKAIEYFESAIAQGFNISASHLFLGMIRFNSGGNPIKAKQDFQEVEQDGLPEMKVAAHYYLGLIYLKEGYPSLGREKLLEAKDAAREISGNKTASDVGAGADAMIQSFSHGQWFANLSILAQYDSNISQVPSSSAAESQPAYRSTPQGVLAAGVGYMSPADAVLQYVPTYQFGYNYNLNPNTREFEYASNTASVYLNYHPLERLSGGLKFQGSFTFQNAPEDPSSLKGSYSLSKYSLTGDFGPFAKLQISPRMRLETELGFSPQTFYTTPDLSGGAYYFRTTLRTEGSRFYFNPGGTVSLGYDATDGSSLKYRSWGLSVFDVIRLSLKDTITISLDLTSYDYFDTSPLRKDSTINPHLSGAHLINNHWSLVGDAGYTDNISSVSDTYSYTRWVLGAGASYAF